MDFHHLIEVVLVPMMRRWQMVVKITEPGDCPSASAHVCEFNEGKALEIVSTGPFHDPEPALEVTAMARWETGAPACAGSSNTTR